MAEDNKNLVRRWATEIFNRRNLETCEEIMAEIYIENAVAPFGVSAPGRVNGPEHMRSIAHWLFDQFPDLHFTIEDLIADNDVVACRILSEDTNTGMLNGVIPPTGKRFSAHQTHWFRVEGRKLAEHWATRDDLPMLIQLGVIQPPGPPRA